jgi:hypothetical protein
MGRLRIARRMTSHCEVCEDVLAAEAAESHRDGADSAGVAFPSGLSVKYAGSRSTPTSDYVAGAFSSVDDLIAAIEKWVTHWNDAPTPFVWHYGVGLAALEMSSRLDTCA